MADPPISTALRFPFDNSYARELEGCYVPWSPRPVPEPVLLRLNRSLAEELGLDGEALDSPEGARIFAGVDVPTGAQPIAQAYAGHQFGGFAPQLGDGRAMLLGEVIDRQGRRRDIALKGSGITAFSRGGDGKAAVGPVLREYLLGEAMHALGIPTTRALAATRTGEWVRRDRPLPGAVLTRVAASHLRVGTFEFFAARGDWRRVRQLADYVIARHDPELIDAPDRYWQLLRAVAQRQAQLVAQWMLVGFIHGVMNTDNMALSGETIDYGPCAFLEAYHPRTVFSSIDSGGRYAYANQPLVARWNLARFAETLLPLFESATSEESIQRARDVLDEFPRWYDTAWCQGMRRKLGLPATSGDDAADRQLAAGFLELLDQQSVDYTLAWRRLADAVTGDELPLRALFTDPQPLDAWLERWRLRLTDPVLTPTERAAAMRRVNPIYIPRNHLVEEALSAASDAGDLGPFDRLLEAIIQPWDERSAWSVYATPAPSEFTACYRTFCGT